MYNFSFGSPQASASLRVKSVSTEHLWWEWPKEAPESLRAKLASTSSKQGSVRGPSGVYGSSSGKASRRVLIPEGQLEESAG